MAMCEVCSSERTLGRENYSHASFRGSITNNIPWGEGRFAVPLKYQQIQMQWQNKEGGKVNCKNAGWEAYIN